jgi:hypothetical protein
LREEFQFSGLTRVDCGADEQERNSQLKMAADDVINFECVISLPKNIRILASAFQCLAKLGKDVSLEAQSSNRSLTLRCVNDAKTSFVAFEFHGEFFEMFNVPMGESVTVQVKLKSCLPVFRSIKTVEKLSISFSTMDNIKHVIVFQALCLSDIVKTHHFYYEDADALDPQFDREGAKHRIRTRPKLLQEAFGRIHNTEEVNVSATAGIELAIASVHSRSDLKNKTVKTVMKIPKNDFEEFSISDPQTRLLFSVRELRALLSFCMAPGVDIADVFLLFNDPGEPFMFTTAKKFEEGLMATAQDEMMQEEVARQQSASGHFSFTLVISTIDDEEPGTISQVPPTGNQSQEE